MSPPPSSLYLQQKRSFFYSCFVQIFIHSCVGTAVDFSSLRNFRLTLYIYIGLLSIPHLSCILNEYAHTRVAKEAIYYDRQCTEKENDVCVHMSSN
jgi:hypothetical protein